MLPRGVAGEVALVDSNVVLTPMSHIVRDNDCTSVSKRA